MHRIHTSLAGIVLSGLLALGLARAQDDSTAADATAGSSADAKPPRTPQPALIVPLASKYALLDIAQAGERLVAVGDHGDIVVSDNRSSNPDANADNWRQVDSPVDVMLTRLFFLDDKRGWAVGHDGAILHTVDGGLSWAIQRWVPDKGPLYDILFLDDRNGWAIGSYASLLRTTDGGQTWNAVGADITEPGLHFNAIVRLADGNLFIAGERGMMARSSDGGGSWSLLDSPYRGSLFGALPWGEHGVIAFGLRGNIYVADDLRSATAIPVAGWDEFDHGTTTDVAGVAKLGWHHLENPSNESLLRGHLFAGGALLTGIDGVLVRIAAADASAAGQNALSLVKSGENETLSGLLPLEDRWMAVGARGVRPLKINTGDAS